MKQPDGAIIVILEIALITGLMLLGRWIMTLA